MKILIKQFLSQKHSWSYIGHELARQFIKQGHEVDLFPTDGNNGIIPSDLKKHVIGYKNLNSNKIFGKEPEKIYDMQYSYTALKNVEHYLLYAKNRYAQWTYEWVSTNNKNILPPGFNIAYKYCDYILAPSNYTKDYQFIPAKIPENKIKVIPHGVNKILFKSNKKIPLNTDKSFKFLVNLQQTHLRKNLEGVLEAYGRAFTNKDDVCLIIKAKDKKPEATFEFSLNKFIKSFCEKYKEHAEVKIISEFIPDIVNLYNSIDCLVSLSYGEGFGMIILESLCAGKPVITTSLGPHLDFTNEKDTLYVKSKFEKTNPKSMYWHQSPLAEWIVSDINDIAEKMIYMVKNYNNFFVDKEYYLNTFSWERISHQILNLNK